mmetsp:Transcript_23939/g.74537  ORF Transcript_23939/g.74537 Transcript_23939/m.74537 type:complete len:242 (-) Transcript_23939:793-1518(-)
MCGVRTAEGFKEPYAQETRQVIAYPYVSVVLSAGLVSAAATAAPAVWCACGDGALGSASIGPSPKRLSPPCVAANAFSGWPAGLAALCSPLAAFLPLVAPNADPPRSSSPRERWAPSRGGSPSAAGSGTCGGGSAMSGGRKRRSQCSMSRQMTAVVCTRSWRWASVSRSGRRRLGANTLAIARTLMRLCSSSAQTLRRRRQRACSTVACAGGRVAMTVPTFASSTSSGAPLCCSATCTNTS